MIPKAENQDRRRIGCKPDNRHTLFAYREKEDRRVLEIRARKIRSKFQGAEPNKSLLLNTPHFL